MILEARDDALQLCRFAFREEKSRRSDWSSIRRSNEPVGSCHVGRVAALNRWIVVCALLTLNILILGVEWCLLFEMVNDTTRLQQKQEEEEEKTTFTGQLYLVHVYLATQFSYVEVDHETRWSEDPDKMLTVMRIEQRRRRRRRRRRRSTVCSAQ